MNRRGFLGAILAAAAAPAIVRADALMRIVPRETTIVPAAGGYMVPEEFAGLFTGEIGRYEGVRFVESRINYGHGLSVAAYADGEIPIAVMVPIGINDGNASSWTGMMKERLIDLLRPVSAPPSSPQATAR